MRLLRDCNFNVLRPVQDILWQSLFLLNVKKADEKFLQLWYNKSKYSENKGGNCVRIAICDDDGEAVERLEALLHTYQQGNRFDLIFLEADMKGLSGLEAARQIRELDGQVMLVFVSACPEYMPKAFDVAAKQFLLKPLQPGELRKVYFSCLQQFRAIQRRIVLHVRTAQKESFLFAANVKEIVLIEVERGKTAVYLQGQEKLYVREKIGVLEERLKDFGFVRPNSGALVQLRYLERIDLERLQILLELTGQLHTVPIARRKKKEILQQYQAYWVEPGRL